MKVSGNLYQIITVYISFNFFFFCSFTLLKLLGPSPVWLLSPHRCCACFSGVSQVFREVWLGGESIIWYFPSVRSEKLLHQMFTECLLFLTVSLYLTITPPNCAFTAVTHFVKMEGITALKLKSYNCLWPDLHIEQNSGNSIVFILKALLCIQNQRIRIFTLAGIEMFFSQFTFLLPCIIHTDGFSLSTGEQHGRIEYNNTQVNFCPFCFSHQGWNSAENDTHEPWKKVACILLAHTLR